VRSGAGGAAFHVFLPVSEDEAPPARAAMAAGGRRSVLVIDDDAQVSALVERILSRAGYAAEAEREPLRALELVSQRHYDVVVCDLLMPQISGMELHERVSQLSPTLARRFIFITGDATRPTVQSFLQGSGLPYVLKPFAAQQLLAVVEGMFEAGGEVSKSI
jgi:DNA-binding NtrC family response regulator